MDMDLLFKELESQNYWNGQVEAIGVLRKVYLDKIAPFSGNRLIKVLVGQRRTGKSYILRQVIHELIHNGVLPTAIFYLDKEQLSYNEITDYKQLDALIKEYQKRIAPKKNKLYLLIDEVQEIDGWERLVVSYAQDKRKDYEIYLTGSNSHMLSSELGTYLSGRHVPIAVFPFSFQEFALVYHYGLDKNALEKYLRQGGLPELINLDSDEAKHHYVGALRDSIFLNDIVKKFGVQDVKLLEQLFLFFCSSIGSLFSINKIVRHLNSKGAKTNVETLSRYIDYLERSLLIHKCERYDIKGKEILGGNKKYYLNDLAFKEYLSSGFDAGFSRRLENIVFLHLKSLGYNVYVGSVQRYDVDFVVEKNGAKAYVQVCYLLLDESVVEREYRSLEAIRDNYPKLVVSLDVASFGERNGIRHLTAWEFLAQDSLLR